MDAPQNRIGNEPLHLVHAIPTKWLWTVWRPEYFVCGKNVDIGAYTAIFAHAGVVIGDDVQIGAHCRIYSLNTEDNTHGKIWIRDGVHIGCNTTILPLGGGVPLTIGKGARIGAHSLVKICIPDGALAYGVPARIVAHMTDEDTIE